MDRHATAVFAVLSLFGPMGCAGRSVGTHHGTAEVVIDVLKDPDSLTNPTLSGPHVSERRSDPVVLKVATVGSDYLSIELTGGPIAGACAGQAKKSSNASATLQPGSFACRLVGSNGRKLFLGLQEGVLSSKGDETSLTIHGPVVGVELANGAVQGLAGMPNGGTFSVQVHATRDAT